MAIRIQIPTPLRPYAGHATSVEVEASTVGEALSALAGHHLAVSKHVAGGRTTARVSVLERNERVEELARMLAGERVTETTRRQARELLAAPAAKA